MYNYLNRIDVDVGCKYPHPDSSKASRDGLAEPRTCSRHHRCAPQPLCHAFLCPEPRQTCISLLSPVLGSMRSGHSILSRRSFSGGSWISKLATDISTLGVISQLCNIYSFPHWTSISQIVFVSSIYTTRDNCFYAFLIVTRGALMEEALFVT